MAIVLRGNGESTFSNDVGIDGTITDSLTVANGLTLTDGNLVVADGHGIDFSATANSSGTMNSELLDDYEEGSWTPTVSVGTVDVLANNGSRYTKVGNLVTVSFLITNFSNQASNDYITVQSLPFTLNADSRAVGACMQRHTGYASVVAYMATSEINFYALSTTTYTPLKYSHLSNVSANFFVTITYETTQ